MNHCTAEQLIAFEARIRGLWNAGELPFLTHLAGGNEAQLVEIFKGIAPGDWVFASHRCHYHALLVGIPPEEVEAKIRDGKSMFIYDASRNFCVSAILGGTCGIAVGVAVALKEEGSPNRVWCFLGDGAEENGRLHEAAIYAEGHGLPVTFIIEDNDQQVETSKLERRGGPVLGLEEIFGCVRRYHYKPTYPHAGTQEVPNPAYNPEVVAKHS
jgi:TPP-dependent pyruvate/acetoin dehydrogenase alpha subunit